MREGAWINARTGEYWWVPEHCTFAKSPQGADAMGLPQSVRDKIKDMPSDFNGPGREAVLIEVMKAGYIRFRGHGAAYTCEFWGDTYRNLWACYAFLKEQAGAYTGCVINNLKTKEQIGLSFSEFEQRMKEDEASVLRVATKILGFTTRKKPKS